MLPSELPAVSNGALTLLTIALQKDKQKLLTRSDALRLCLEYAARLPGCCQKGANAVAELLQLPSLPSTFFRFLVELVNFVDREIGARPYDPSVQRWNHSEYDHPALLALGQTVSHVAGTKNAEGPSVQVGIGRIAGATPRQLQLLFVSNYFGNILQDYFDACELRRRMPSLPADTEFKLRQSDAHNMAVWLFDGISATNEGVIIDDLQVRMGKLMVALFKKEALG